MTGSEAEHQSQFLPPGFRFHPTDEELIQHYLRKRDAGEPCPVPIIAEVDIYKFNPWDLPSMAKHHHQQQGAESYGCSEWYFFSPRDRKYPNGARPNRAAGSGYWKATGTDKPIVATSNTAAGGGERASGRIGVKKALVFYKGKPPKGIKTNWIMHEYRLTDHQQPSQFYHVLHPVKNKDSSSMRLDDWVLCRIYEKAHNHQESPGTPTDDQLIPGGVDEGAMDDSKNNFVALQQLPSSYPSGTSTSNLDKSGSLWDIFCGVDADYSMLSQLRFTADNPQRNPPPDLHLQQHRHPSSAIIGKSPMNITSAINSASLSAGYFNSGNSVDSSGAISTTVIPISELHQWPPLPQEPPSLKAMATTGWCLKRQRESDDGFLGHMESAVVTALHLAKKECTDRSSGFSSTKNTATSNSCVLPGYENLLGTPSQFGTMDTRAYQLGHHDILPNPKFLPLQ